MYDEIRHLKMGGQSFAVTANLMYDISAPLVCHSFSIVKTPFYFLSGSKVDSKDSKSKNCQIF